MRTLLLAALASVLGLLLAVLVGCKSEPEHWDSDICGVIQTAMAMESDCCQGISGACSLYADFLQEAGLTTVGACDDFEIDARIYDEHCSHW